MRVGLWPYIHRPPGRLAFPHDIQREPAMAQRDEPAMVYLVDDDAPRASRLVAAVAFSRASRPASSHRATNSWTPVIASRTGLRRGRIDHAGRRRDRSSTTAARVGARYSRSFCLPRKPTAIAAPSPDLAGALLFFRKPVDGQALIDAVEWALGEDSPRRRELSETEHRR